MKARVEHFGAWVRTDSPAALVAIDRDGARALGIDGNEIWNGEGKNPRRSKPTSP